MNSPRRLTVALAAALLALTPLAAATVRATTTASDDVYAVDEDQVLVVDALTGVLVNDTSDEGALCVTGTVGAEFEGSLQGVNEDGSFTYTPPPDFNGTTSFGYSVALVVDGVCTDDPILDGDGDATVTITVSAVNDAPTAKGDSFTALRDRTLNVAGPGVLLNDGDVDGDSLSAVKVSNPAHGVVTLASDGAFSYTPNSGYTGPDGFSYRASDGTATSGVRVVSITVTAIPTPIPTAVPTPVPTVEATPTTEPSSIASAEPSGSPDPFATASAAPSGAASASPGASIVPVPVDDEGGLSIPTLAVGLLLLSLLAFGGAYLVPKWLARQRAGEPPLD